jgi:ADP-ribosylglycohydrolase
MQDCGISPSGRAFNQPPGTWSDDTALTLCLADSLSRGFSLQDIANNFLRWRDGEFTANGKSFDIGQTTAKAILRLKSGTPPEKSGCPDAHDNGNGSLMRIAPLIFLTAVNLGGDTDTTAAVCGALSGLYYLDLPSDWLHQLASKEIIQKVVDGLARRVCPTGS